MSSGVSGQRADELGELARAGDVRELPAGATLFSQDDEAGEMFVLESGTLELRFDEGKPPKRLGPGSVVGEIALVTKRGRRSATAVAVEPCRLRVVSRARFEELMESRPALICAALQRACEVLVESENALIADLRARNAELERALDFLRRTRAELGAQELAARTDQLTGLYNRRCLDEQLPRFIERARASGSGLALLSMDLDGFKPINDRYGHAAGDAVLRAVGGYLRESVRGDDLPCRLGGDEFVLLLASATDVAASALAARLREGVAALQVRAGDDTLRVGVTIGGTILQQEDDADSVLRRSDRYLYDAKEAGRGRVGWEGNVIPCA